MQSRVIPFIFASGHGTRLRPLTHELPKPLIPVQGDKTIIDLIIDELIRNGFKRALINYSYGKEYYLELQKRYAATITLELVDDHSVCGQGGILIKEREALQKYDTVLCLNGDTIIICDIAALIKRSKKTEAVLLTDNALPVHPNLLCDPDGVICGRESALRTGKEVWYKPQPATVTTHNYLGVALFPTQALQTVNLTGEFMGFFGAGELVDQLTKHHLVLKVTQVPVDLFLTANTVEELMNLRASLQ